MLILGLVFWPGVAAAQSAQGNSSGQYKIGVFDRKVVMEGYKKVEVEYNKLQEEVDERQKEIDKLSAQINKAKEDYEEIKDSLSTEERAEREAEIQNNYREYQSKLQTQQAEIDTKERLLMKKVFSEIDKAVEKIGNEQGYHLILEGGAARTAVVWHSPTIDISQKVVEVLNSAS